LYISAVKLKCPGAGMDAGLQNDKIQFSVIVLLWNFAIYINRKAFSLRRR
jgi:hypothetical protein